MSKRYLLKISGESIADKDNNQTFNTEKLNLVASVIGELVNQGNEVAIVIGAGNIWRGKLANTINIDPADADFMGMTATVINATALTAAIKNLGFKAVCMSAIHVPPITLPFDENKARALLADKNIVVFGGGTGKPFFTTDTAATLRAIQIEADGILMAKYGVDGVYSADPNLDKNAVFFDKLTFNEVLEKGLKVMDLSAIELVKDKDINIHVFNMDNPKNILKVVSGEKIGTIVSRGN